ITRCSTPAVWSWAASSGGRNSVLNGTTVPPARATPSATTGHAVPLGMSTPTRVPLPTPAAANRDAVTAVSRSSSPYVSTSSSVTTNGFSGCSAARRRTSAGTVRRSALIEPLDDRALVRLAGREHGQLVGPEHEEATRHLVRREPGPQALTDRFKIGGVVGFGEDDGADDLAPLGVGETEHQRTEAAGDLA